MSLLLNLLHILLNQKRFRRYFRAKAIKLLLLLSILVSGVANAGYLCSYATHILDGHKYNTNGKKLQNASAIIQQERGFP